MSMIEKAMYDRLFSLTDKTALVTGASYGLGVTFAKTLAQAGANLALAARSADKLKAVEGSINKAGGRAIALAYDVTEAPQVEAAVDAAIEHFGRVDILVNNAGQAADVGMPERIPNESFEQTVRVNLLGTWYCCRAVGRRMLSDGKGGSIINIASVAGMCGLRDFLVAYQAAKAAVINLTRGLACSWADRGVRVNTIALATFPSQANKEFLAIPIYLDWVKRASPMGRLGELSELEGPLLFLASPASSYVTGHTLVVDGGFAATIGCSPWPDDFYGLLADLLPDDLGRHIRPR